MPEVQRGDTGALAKTLSTGNDSHTFEIVVIVDALSSK
jgi:hypothetical protein